MALGVGGCSAAEDPPVADAPTTDALVTTFCDKLVALECVGASLDTAALAQARSSCIQRFILEAQQLTPDKCPVSDVPGILGCFTDAVRCPDGWSGESLDPDEVVVAASGVCEAQSPGLAECGDDPGNGFSCQPAPAQPGPIQLDLDGDGVVESLSPNVEDRRTTCNFDMTQNHLIIEMPPFIVPAATETFTCMYGTWTGADMGIVDFRHGSDIKSNHHLTLHAVPEGATVTVDDGVLVPCDSVEHTPGQVLFHGLTVENLGSPLRAGQRYYAERHSLNPSPHPILVDATVWLGLVPIDQLEGIAIAYIFGPNDIHIPEGDYHIKSTCAWKQDTTVLAATPHLHEHGTFYALDWISDAGTERLLEVDPWEYSNDDIYQHIFEGGLAVKAGDKFVTHCAWHNTTGGPIITPQEMCNTFGVAFPLDAPYECDGGTEVVP